MVLTLREFGHHCTPDKTGDPPSRYPTLTPMFSLSQFRNLRCSKDETVELTFEGLDYL